MKTCSFRLPQSIPFVILLLAAGIGSMANAQIRTQPPSSDTPATNTGPDKDRIIADLLRRVEALERKIANAPGAAPATTAPAASPEVPAASGTASSQQGSAVPPVAAAASPGRASGGPSSAANEPADEETSRALERTLVREGGLVLPPKTFEVEPRLTYEHRSSNALQIVGIGGQTQVTSQDRKRGSTEASLGLRVGLPWATQLEMTLPYSVNRERRVIAGGSGETERASGFGNFEIGLTKQLLREAKGTPGLLGSVRWSRAGEADDFGSPVAVGSSFRSLQGALTVVKRQDPLVFFGSLAHAVSSSRTIGGATIDPGNSTGLKLGSIFAVSPDASMRLGFEYTRSREASVNGIKLAGSDGAIGMFNTGFSVVLSPRMLLGVEAEFGLTSDSPDFRLGLSLPIRF